MEAGTAAVKDERWFTHAGRSRLTTRERSVRLMAQVAALKKPLSDAVETVVQAEGWQTGLLFWVEAERGVGIQTTRCGVAVAEHLQTVRKRAIAESG